ncbi:MAG: hypothetical protein OES24_04275 [Acidimicrobiia bacterium]|nr:hypothetical protein [Acidimicrobiia bacterium]
MTAGLLLTALALGLRHGVDWDHIAAIAELSGAANDRRRGFRLSLLYAFGHAAVVFVLGCVAIIAGTAIPDGLDRWMGRVVGLTLIWLGVWVIVELVRHGRDFRLRSRWLLVLDGTFAGFRRVASAADRRLLEIEHEHEHEHEHDDAARIGDFGEDVEETPIGGHGRRHRHRHPDDHDSFHETTEIRQPVGVGPAAAAADPVDGGPLRRLLARRTRHSHAHRHVVPLPDRLGAASETGAGTATGIGMLHGVGVESPTQIAVFVASTSVVGWTAGLAILAAWCVGLVVANSGLSLLAGFGLLEARRNFAVYATVAVVVAIGSIVMGTLYLFELDVLPAITI